MSIPNVKRYRITSPDGTMSASLMAVLPKDIDVNKYLSEASQRFDWKAYQEAQAEAVQSPRRSAEAEESEVVSRFVVTAAAREVYAGCGCLRRPHPDRDLAKSFQAMASLSRSPGARQHDTQLDFLIFGGRAEHAVDGLADGLFAGQFDQERHCHIPPGPLIHGVQQDTGAARKSSVFNSPKSTSANAADRRGFMLCSSLNAMVKRGAIRGIPQAAQPFLGGGTHLIVLVVQIFEKQGVVGRIGQHGQRFERCALHFHVSRVGQRVAHLGRGVPVAQQASGFERLHSGFSPPDRCNRKLMRGAAAGSPIFWIATSDSYINLSSLECSASIRSGMAARPRRTPTARAALARASRLAAPRASFPSATITSGRT